MTKFKDYFKKMLAENKAVFDVFRKLHASYSLTPDDLQDEFNTKGGEIIKIAREWESKLCSHSEKAGYSNYSGNLAEKFQGELRREFPLIDHVGIIVAKPRSTNFNLKKIKLN